MTQNRFHSKNKVCTNFLEPFLWFVTILYHVTVFVKRPLSQHLLLCTFKWCQFWVSMFITAVTASPMLNTTWTLVMGRRWTRLTDRARKLGLLEVDFKSRRHLTPTVTSYHVVVTSQTSLSKKNFHQCYNCVKRDFVIDKEQANCDGTSRSYRFRGFIDPVTNQKHIECLNDPGSCKRAICECDKKLAMDLRENEFKVSFRKKILKTQTFQVEHFQSSKMGRL